ncbi:MAG: ABC transporter ATP-binding protein [Gammaproteobacteria bacterium]|nr:ABC transporter ATP-binding protein [Gammaproteobacteria bacterium]MBA3731350.1 ABC transporter ATP-binding protein [Gammaproteobacteria bacterium]
MNLATHHLAFGYAHKTVGHDVSLTVESGQILCVLGANGSGKTTLFKTLLGLLKPRGGDITLDDESVLTWPRRRQAQTMAYVPQAHADYFPFTVLDTVLMGRAAHMSLFAVPSQRDREAALAALHALSIADLKDEPYAQISGGQRQLVLIARALAQEAKFLILDEPTSSLDFGHRGRLLEHIRKLAREGPGIIFSTHDPDQALVCADTVALLREGRVIQSGAPDAVITRENLRLIYGVDVDTTSALYLA